MLLVAEIEIEGQILTVMVCHFGLEKLEKCRAIETLRREVGAIRTPLVFMGDLNITPDSEEYRELTAFLCDAASASAANSETLLTFPAREPRIKIDYIFTNTLCKAVSFEVLCTGYSDHVPIRAEIEF